MMSAARRNGVTPPDPIVPKRPIGLKHPSGGPAAGGDPRGEVVVGIDAGGSSTRARAVRAGHVVFDGVGGPGNPATMSESELTHAYGRALANCPSPARVAACVAGAGSAMRQDQVTDVLTALVPGADIVVYPDYYAPLKARHDADVCVIAGTGSVVCSRGSGAEVHASGGRGWMLGDPGSAAWLGRAILGHFVDQPEDFDEDTRRRVLTLYRATRPGEIVHHLNTSAVPPAALAVAAPVLSDLAAAGEGWAQRELRNAMTQLAEAVSRHIDRFMNVEDPIVALSGGVWKAHVCVQTFTTALAVARPLARVIAEPMLDPVNGAVELALQGAMA